MSEPILTIVNRLIILSGLDKSPDEVIALLQPSPIKRLWRWLGNGVNHYALMRLESLYRDEEVADGPKIIALFGWLAIVSARCVVSAVANGAVAIADIPSLVFISLFSLSLTTVLFISLSKRGFGRSGVNLAWFTIREMTLSLFDPLFWPVFKKATWISDKGTYWIRDGQKRREAILEEGDTLNERRLLLQRFYSKGLKLVEDELLGSKSDWSKALFSLRDRLTILDQRKAQALSRIDSAKEAEDNERFSMSQSAKPCLVSTEQSLSEAVTSTDKLIQRTQHELKKLNEPIDKYIELFCGAELVGAVDVKVGYRDPAVVDPCVALARAREDILHRLTAIVSTVIGHKLLPQSIEATDMPRYFDEIERAATAIMKIGEA